MTSTSLDGRLLPRATSRGGYSRKAGPACFGTKERRSASTVLQAGWTRLRGSRPVLLVVDRARYWTAGSPADRGSRSNLKPGWWRWKRAIGTSVVAPLLDTNGSCANACPGVAGAVEEAR